MKTRRRIEITSFRRRTTIVLRHEPGGGPVVPPSLHVEASQTAPADPPQGEDGSLDLQGRNAHAVRHESPEGREQVVTKK